MKTLWLVEVFLEGKWKGEMEDVLQTRREARSVSRILRIGGGYQTRIVKFIRSEG